MARGNVIAPIEPLEAGLAPTAEWAGDAESRDDHHMSRVMIVDDEPTTIVVVRRALEKRGYRQFVTTSDPLEAMGLARHEPPDIVLLDVNMPGLNGFEVLAQLQAEMPEVPVIFLTASPERSLRVRAFDLGVVDFLSKPVDTIELAARVRNALVAKHQQDRLRHYSQQLETEVRARTAALEVSRQELIHCLARAAEFRDDCTGQHILRVGRYARLIAAALGYPANRLEMLEQAARLHDIGKIGIPDAILLKPGKLSAEEFDCMQRHCNLGKQIIERLPPADEGQLRRHAELGARILGTVRSPLLELARTIALTHHERWDGRGYPLGLAGDDIPLEGRITAVADVFDALSTKRVYKPAFPVERCLQILEEGRGAQFDPRVLDAFFTARDDVVQTQIALADNL